MLDHLDDIASDLSVFHGVREPMELDSPRYFKFAERLHHYGGAVAAARALQPIQQRTVEAPQVPVAPTQGIPASRGEQPVVVDDLARVVAMTKAPGFPGIEFVPGG